VPPRRRKDVSKEQMHLRIRSSAGPRHMDPSITFAALILESAMSRKDEQRQEMEGRRSSSTAGDAWLGANEQRAPSGTSRGGMLIGCMVGAGYTYRERSESIPCRMTLVTF